MLHPQWLHTVCNPGQALTNAHSHIDFLMARPPQNKQFCSFFADVLLGPRKFRSGAPRQRFVSLYNQRACFSLKWCPSLLLLWSWCHSITARVNDSCHICIHVTFAFMSHLHSCHICIHVTFACYVAYEWVMSRISESCRIWGSHLTLLLLLIRCHFQHRVWMR